MLRRQIFLYAEDSENDVLLVRSAIKKAELPIDLYTVADGEEVVHYVSGKGRYADRRKYPVPTLMLLDIKLPKKDGYQVLRWLRQQPHLRRMVVVVLTASRRQEDVDRAHESGANAVLVKPAKIEELIDMVENLSAWIELTLKPSIDVTWKSAL